MRFYAYAVPGKSRPPRQVRPPLTRVCEPWSDSGARCARERIGRRGHLAIIRVRAVAVPGAFGQAVLFAPLFMVPVSVSPLFMVPRSVIPLFIVPRSVTPLFTVPRSVTPLFIVPRSVIPLFTAPRSVIPQLALAIDEGAVVQ